MSQKSNRRQSQRVTARPNYDVSLRDDNDVSQRIKVASDKLVLYLLQHLNNTTPLRRQDLHKHIGSVKGAGFNKIIDAAGETLQGVYGYELIIANDTGKNPWYLIKKSTPHVQFPRDAKPPDTKRTLAFLVLTHVFMNNESATEESLFAFLTRLRFDVENANNNGLFGSVRGQLEAMTKAHMIQIEEGVITWGVQAEMLVSKMEILKFVSKMYKNRVEGWGVLYTKAVEQAAMHHVGDDGHVDVDE